MVEVPTTWTDSTLHFLTKPNKPAKRAQDLRPIALQSAGAKAVLLTVKDRLMPFLLAAMVQLPQYAYVAGRGTTEAILRVTLHCSQDRDVIQAQKMTIHDRFACQMLPSTTSIGWSTHICHSRSGVTACAVAWQVRPRLPCLVSSGRLCQPSLFGMRCPGLTMPRPVGVRPLIRPSLWLPFRRRRYFRVANVRRSSIRRMKVVPMVSSSPVYR